MCLSIGLQQPVSRQVLIGQLSCSSSLTRDDGTQSTVSHNLRNLAASVAKGGVMIGVAGWVKGQGVMPSVPAQHT